MQWRQRNRIVIALAASILFAASGSFAWSEFNRPIRMILPFPPGGPADAMARLLAEQIGSTGGPTMVVESHPGAATEIGTELVSRSTPDGYTLGIISNSFVTLPNVRKLNYDPLKDFTPVCQVASFPPLIVVNSGSPYHTFADLLAAARAQPAALTLGSIGPASSSQITFEMLKHAAKVDITFVPFSGYTPAIQALLGSQITSVLADFSTLQGLLQTGKLRALATTARARFASLPDVPTVTESGYEVVGEFFGGVVAPAKTPAEMVSRLTGLFSAAIAAPQIKAKFAALGFYPGGACGADFAAILQNDYDEYGRIIREAHIKFE
jgi:tripartite-type tricarboxylate transporter receptor subunit TctC